MTTQSITAEQLIDWIAEKRAKVEEIDSFIARIDHVFAGDNNQAAGDEEVILAELMTRRKELEQQIQDLCRNYPDAAEQAGYTEDLVALLA